MANCPALPKNMIKFVSGTVKNPGIELFSKLKRKANCIIDWEYLYVLPLYLFLSRSYAILRPSPMMGTELDRGIFVNSIRQSRSQC